MSESYHDLNEEMNKFAKKCGKIIHMGSWTNSKDHWCGEIVYIDKLKKMFEASYEEIEDFKHESSNLGL